MANAILYLDHAPVWGGAEVVLVNLLHALDPQEVRPFIATAPHSPLAQHLANSPFPVLPVPFDTLNHAGWRLPLHLGQSVTAVTRHIRQHQITLIHTNTVRAHIVGSLAGWLTRTPVVWTLHDNTFPLRLVRLLAGIPRYVIAVSGWLRDLYQPHGLASKISVIPNGLPAPPSPPTTPPLLAELGLPPETQLIVAVGRLIPSKGAHHLITAAHQLAADFPRTAFVLVGGDEAAHAGYAQNIRDEIAASPLGQRLQWIGQRADVGRFYAAADVVVYAATAPEGLPTVLLEAMAYARPVVATAIGGALDMVADGRTGLLIPPDDPSNLAAAISQLLSDPNQRLALAAAGQAQWQSHFTIERQTNATMAIYHTIWQQGNRL